MAKKKSRSNDGESKPKRKLPENLQLVATEYKGPSLAEQIESAFSNPLAYTRFTIWGDRYLSQVGEPNLSPDLYLSEIKREIDDARVVLENLSTVMREHGNVSLSERARARSILTDLSRWLVETVIIQRSEGAPEEYRDSLTLPSEVINWITELSTIGKHLRDVWLELGSPLPPGGLTPVGAEAGAPDRENVEVAEGQLVVFVGRDRAAYRGQEHDLSGAQTEILSRLVQARGAWVPGWKIRGGRIDRIVAALPAPLAELIESKKARGYRLVPGLRAVALEGH